MRGDVDYAFLLLESVPLILACGFMLVVNDFGDQSFLLRFFVIHNVPYDGIDIDLIVATSLSDLVWQHYNILLFVKHMSILFYSVKNTTRYTPLLRFGLVLRTRQQSVESCLGGANRFAPDPSSLAKLSIVWLQFKSHLCERLFYFDFPLKAEFLRRCTQPFGLGMIQKYCR